jgi:hypothetical protein
VLVITMLIKLPTSQCQNISLTLKMGKAEDRAARHALFVGETICISHFDVSSTSDATLVLNRLKSRQKRAMKATNLSPNDMWLYVGVHPHPRRFVKVITSEDPFPIH